MTSGALTFVTKPIQTQEVLDRLLDPSPASFIVKKNVLLVEENEKRRDEIMFSTGLEDVQVIDRQQCFFCAEKAAQAEYGLPHPGSNVCTEVAKGMIQENEKDGVIADRLPVIVYGEAGMDEAEAKRLGNVYPVRAVQSPDRVLDSALFYLHYRVDALPEAWREKLVDLYQSNKPLAGKKVLIVDDDMRNIFAVSTVLEEHDMEIVSADNGRERSYSRRIPISTSF